MTLFKRASVKVMRPITDNWGFITLEGGEFPEAPPILY